MRQITWHARLNMRVPIDHAAAACSKGRLQPDLRTLPPHHEWHAGNETWFTEPKPTSPPAGRSERLVEHSGGRLRLRLFEHLAGS